MTEREPGREIDALTTLGDQFAEAERRRKPRRPMPRSAGAAVLLAVVTGLAFSPLGSPAVAWVGGLLGGEGPIEPASACRAVTAKIERATGREVDTYSPRCPSPRKAEAIVDQALRTERKIASRRAISRLALRNESPAAPADRASGPIAVGDTTISAGSSVRSLVEWIAGSSVAPNPNILSRAPELACAGGDTVNGGALLHAPVARSARRAAALGAISPAKRLGLVLDLEPVEPQTAPRLFSVRAETGEVRVVASAIQVRASRLWRPGPYVACDWRPRRLQ